MLNIKCHLTLKTYLLYGKHVISFVLTKRIVTHESCWQAIPFYYTLYFLNFKHLSAGSFIIMKSLE